MKYTSKEINFEKLQNNVKKKGFSDRAKKIIGSLLLASQVMSATSSMAQGFAQNVQDFINNPQMFEQTYSDTNKTIEFEKNIITEHGNIKEYTPQDLPEFQSRSINSKRDILDSSNDIFSQASIKFVNGIRDYTREDMLRYKDEGVKLIFFNDGVYELDKYEDILPNNKKDFSLFDAYSPDDMIKIQEYYEKFMDRL